MRNKRIQPKRLLTEAEAQQMVEKFYKTRPEVARWLKRAVERCMDEITPRIGRVLDIPGHQCEEANLFGVMRPGPNGPQPAPCGKPATQLIWHGRRDKPYYMCDACADHNVRNRSAYSLVQKAD